MVMQIAVLPALSLCIWDCLCRSDLHVALSTAATCLDYADSISKAKEVRRARQSAAAAILAAVQAAVKQASIYELAQAEVRQLLANYKALHYSLEASGTTTGQLQSQEGSIVPVVNVSQITWQDGLQGLSDALAAMQAGALTSSAPAADVQVPLDTIQQAGHLLTSTLL